MHLTSKHEQIVFLACVGIYFVPVYRREHFCTLDVLSRQSRVQDVRVRSRLSQSEGRKTEGKNTNPCSL